MTDLEIWLPVIGYEGFYEVSCLGRVRSLARYVVPKRCQKMRQYGGRILAPISNKGYPSVNLSKLNEKKVWQVHTLVCTAFHGPKPPDKEQVAHADGDRSNASADNLRWATRVENEADKLIHGRLVWGEKSKCSRLTESQVIEILAFQARYSVIARTYGVSDGTIRAIKKGRSWKYVDGAPKFVPKGKPSRPTIDFGGITRTVRDWAEHVGIHNQTLRSRLRKGWPIEKALTLPVKEGARA